MESKQQIQSLGAVIPTQLEEETLHAYDRLHEALEGNVAGFVANRLRLSPEELARALATEQVEGVALAIYNIEARGQSVIIGDQTGIGKGRQAAALIRYGMLAGYLPIFLTDRYTLFSDMYRDCKALGIQEARPLILNQKVSIVDFDHPLEEAETTPEDEIWNPSDDEDGALEQGIYAKRYEEVYVSPRKSELELMYKEGDLPAGRFDYMMLTYSQLKDAKKDRTRLEFLTSLCRKHRVLFIFDEAHKSSSVSAGKISMITQCINSLMATEPRPQCVFLSATFAKRPECLLTFMGQTVLSSLATNDTLQSAFANGGVPMQEYVASTLAREGQMVRREHSGEGIPEPVYTYLDDQLAVHSELFDRVMYWFREMVLLSEMVKDLMKLAKLLDAPCFRPYPTRAQLFYVNKILLLSLKARDVADAVVREVKAGRSVVIGMSDTLECVLKDSIDATCGKCRCGDFSTILLRLLDKTLSNPKCRTESVFDLDFSDVPDPAELTAKIEDIRSYADQIRAGIQDEVFHLPMSPIDVIRQLITRETFTDRRGHVQPIRFEECTGRARQLEYLSPEGDDEFLNATIIPKKKRHSNHIFNDFQNNKLDVILINACGAIGASAHAVATAEVAEPDVHQRKMLIVQNDLDVNIDLQKRGRINRTGQIASIPPLYEYIITAIPSEKRLNMMLRSKLRSLSANTTANQDQDKRQADFLDITNKYGNLVAQEYIVANPELANMLGVNKTTTASMLLARIAMLSVAAQQEIIEEIFGAYQNLEQELRRINQWDLEREYRDFEAEFVREELFTAPIDKTALGGASMLSTFRCRHRTFPYDSFALTESVRENMREYGEDLRDSQELRKEIEHYYRTERKKIRDRYQDKRNKLEDSVRAALLKYGLTENMARHVMTLTWARNVVSSEKEIHDCIDGHPKAKRILRKLDSFLADIEDHESRENKELNAKSRQRKKLLDVISRAVIGKGYVNILSWLPVEENVSRVIAVLKEVRFGKLPGQRFLPGKVQFVFALSAVHKELVLNLVDKGAQNNYDRLLGILSSPSWRFSASEWDMEIAKYNNRVLERKIITGNILGAFSNPLIQKIKPRFISFSLASDGGGKAAVERGLLLPMSGENLDKLMSNVTLPVAEGLKYVSAPNHVYSISGIGVDFSISLMSVKGQEPKFYISVNDADSRKFEEDSRFDSIRGLFKATPIRSMLNRHMPSRNPLRHYASDALAASAEEFVDIMILLASLRAVILIPREHLSVGEMKGFTKRSDPNANSHWPSLDWRLPMETPPERVAVEQRVMAPSLKDADITYVEEFPPTILLIRKTLEIQGQDFKTAASTARALYFEWIGLTEEKDISTAKAVSDELHTLLTQGGKDGKIELSKALARRLERISGKFRLSEIGETIARYREEMLFLAPSIEEAQRFLDSCLYDPRLSAIRKSLEDYIAGRTLVVMDV